MKREAVKRKKTPAVPIVRHPRLISRNDGFKVIYIGKRRQGLDDMYARLLGASWKVMIATMCSLYLSINFMFALAYLSLGDGLLNARHGSFPDAFFFSVQTLATIGYGSITPRGMLANILVTIESMFGFAFYGVVTGLVFSKFSRPTARVLFSNRAIIGMQDGHPHFMLRMINERSNRIVDATAKLTMARDEKTPEGGIMRRFHDLKLVRSEIPILRLSWTLMHRIDEHSPLYQMTPETLRESESEIIVSLTGIDETLSQTIHARNSYIADEIACNAAFEDVLHRRENYVLEVRYDKFHELKSKN